MNGPILGGNHRQVELMLADLRKLGGTPTDEVMRGLGEMEMMRQTLRWMAREAAKRMEEKGR